MKVTKILSALLAAVMLMGALMTGAVAENKLPFTDVPADEWYTTAVEYVYGKGLMNGTGNGTTFAPGMNLTRGMVVTVLFRNDGSPAKIYSNPFADVADGQYYATAAAWAYGEGVVTGTGTDEWGDPIFSPDRNITRQELATMFARYAAYKHVDTSKNTAALDSFPDSGKVASWASDSFKWSSGTGIITGKGTGSSATLSPEDLASRAEFAIMIQRYNTKDDAREFTYKLVYETPVLKSQYTEKDYPLAENADVYVAVDGNDNNPGTKEKPLATFEAARAKVREIKKTKTKGEIKVAFKGGDYGILNNVTLTAEDSGSADLKIAYCAYGDGPVYFTNGVYIEESEFVALSESEKAIFPASAVDSIKKVDLSEHPAADKINAFNPLSNENGFCWQARTPNKVNGVDMYYPGMTMNVATPDSPYTMKEIMAQCTEFGYDVEHTVIRPYTEQKKLQALNALKTRMDGYHTYENVQVCGYVSKVWEFDVMNIKEYDRSNGVMEFHNESIRGFVNVDLQQQAYINNVSEELDDAGEYWIDPATKTLYVYKPQGNYSITTDGTFLTIQKKVNNISLVKLNFRICNNDGILAHGDDFTMDQCSVTYIGGTHALYSEEALNVHITSSTFAYCAETGVNVEGPEPGDREDHDYYALQSTGFVFDNNVIHDVNLVYVPVESGGIKVRWQIGAVVSHNEIYNSGRYGVDYKYGNIDCIFEYNYLHHCMQNSADGGAFYCGRVAINRGNVIRYNLVADIYATNPIHTGGTYAIYLDDAMENLICYGNVFYNSGTIMNNNGRSHDIHDNVFIGNTGIFGKAGYYDISKYHYGVWGNENWSNITRIPDESTPNGKLWKERWPELYDILAICKDPDIDVTKLGLYTKPLNICCDNYFFGDGIDNNFFDEWLELSIHENNVELGEDVNPFFEDPTHGDYSITDTSKIGDNFYDKIGRY